MVLEGEPAGEPSLYTTPGGLTGVRRTPAPCVLIAKVETAHQPPPGKSVISTEAKPLQQVKAGPIIKTLFRPGNLGGG